MSVKMFTVDEIGFSEKIVFGLCYSTPIFYKTDDNFDRREQKNLPMWHKPREVFFIFVYSLKSLRIFLLFFLQNFFLLLVDFRLSHEP